MPNVMAALPNIGGALCSTPQSLADAKPGEICWGAPKLPDYLRRYWAEVHHIIRTCRGGIAA